MAGIPVPKTLPAQGLGWRVLRLVELAQVAAKRRNLGRAFAWNVVGWAVD